MKVSKSVAELKTKGPEPIWLRILFLIVALAALPLAIWTVGLIVGVAWRLGKLGFLLVN